MLTYKEWEEIKVGKIFNEFFVMEAKKKTEPKPRKSKKKLEADPVDHKIERLPEVPSWVLPKRESIPVDIASLVKGGLDKEYETLPWWNDSNSKLTPEELEYLKKLKNDKRISVDPVDIRELRRRRETVPEKKEIRTVPSISELTRDNKIDGPKKTYVSLPWWDEGEKSQLTDQELAFIIELQTDAKDSGNEKENLDDHDINILRSLRKDATNKNTSKYDKDIAAAMNRIRSLSARERENRDIQTIIPEPERSPEGPEIPSPYKRGDKQAPFPRPATQRQFKSPISLPAKIAPDPTKPPRTDWGYTSPLSSFLTKNTNAERPSPESPGLNVGGGRTPSGESLPGEMRLRRPKSAYKLGLMPKSGAEGLDASGKPISTSAAQTEMYPRPDYREQLKDLFAAWRKYDFANEFDYEGVQMYFNALPGVVQNWLEKRREKIPSEKIRTKEDEEGKIKNTDAHPYPSPPSEKLKTADTPPPFWWEPKKVNKRKYPSTRGKVFAIPSIAKKMKLKSKGLKITNAEREEISGEYALDPDVDQKIADLAANWAETGKDEDGSIEKWLDILKKEKKEGGTKQKYDLSNRKERNKLRGMMKVRKQAYDPAFQAEFKDEIKDIYISAEARYMRDRNNKLMSVEIPEGSGQDFISHLEKEEEGKFGSVTSQDTFDNRLPVVHQGIPVMYPTKMPSDNDFIKAIQMMFAPEKPIYVVQDPDDKDSPMLILDGHITWLTKRLWQKINEQNDIHDDINVAVVIIQRPWEAVAKRAENWEIAKPEQKKLKYKLPAGVGVIVNKFNMAKERTDKDYQGEKESIQITDDNINFTSDNVMPSRAGDNNVLRFEVFSKDEKGIPWRTEYMVSGKWKPEKDTLVLQKPKAKKETEAA